MFLQRCSYSVKLPSVSTTGIEVFTELEVGTQRPLWRYCSSSSNQTRVPFITSSAVGHMVSSNRCETAGLLLGMEIVIHYLKQRFTKSHSGIIYIFRDCINAIDAVTKKAVVNRHPEIFQKIHHISSLLYDISCCVKLVKIPNHKGIHGNVLADQKAKEHAQKILNRKISVPELHLFQMHGRWRRRLQKSLGNADGVKRPKEEALSNLFRLLVQGLSGQRVGILVYRIAECCSTT